MNIFSVLFIFSLFFYNGMSCGIDNSTISHIYEGLARIETYPWLGILYYPYDNKRFTTAVVLVTKQIVLATANEIDRIPKTDFRSRARVVIGCNCSGPEVGIRDYTYHPDYSRDTYSALAIIQLETDHVTIELRPICPPPSYFNNQQFYAMILSENCRRSKVRIYKMEYVSREQCQDFYRRSGLDVATMWPSHTACARSLRGGSCVWRSGAILVVKTGYRWRLLGFGVYGPGCQMPARFIDYGMYHSWVQRSVEMIGKPAISTLGQNHVVMRRSLSNVQRFGPCDPEEMKQELYTDFVYVSHREGKMTYNITIVDNIEYSCIVFEANSRNVKGGKPTIILRRWYENTYSGNATDEMKEACYGFGYLSISFYVQITYEWSCNFRVMAYGREVKVLEPFKVQKYTNEHNKYRKIESYAAIKRNVTKLLNDNKYPWFTKIKKVL